MNAVKVIPAVLNLSADWGGSLEFSLALTDPATGNPYNVSTALEIWFTAKNVPQDSDGQAVVQVTKTSGKITVGGTDNNIIRVRVDDVGTTLSNVNDSLWCDCKIKTSDAFIKVVASGKLQVNRVITESV